MQLTNDTYRHFAQYFNELLDAGQSIEFSLFEKLVAELLNHRFGLRERLAKSKFFLCKLNPGPEMAAYEKRIEQFRQAVVSHFKKEGSQHEYNLHLWLFSRALLRLTNTLSSIATVSFQLALRNIFLDENDLKLFHKPSSEVYFSAGEMFRITGDLLQEIDGPRIHEMVWMAQNLIFRKSGLAVGFFWL